MNTPSAKERRLQKEILPHENNISIIDKISVLFAGFQVSDILSTQHHSDDFKDTRALFILNRLKSMAIIFSIIVPLSFVMDVFLLADEQIFEMFIARVVLATMLLALAFSCTIKNLSLTLSLLLPLGFLFPSIFNFFTQFILSLQPNIIDVVGYSYMPFLMVAMLALFPLTTIYSISIIIIIFIPFIGVELYLGQFFTMSTFNKVWAFSMFAGITLWLQTGQLVMLLKLYRESTLDPLTGLINRRVLMKRLDKEINAKNYVTNNSTRNKR